MAHRIPLAAVFAAAALVAGLPAARAAEPAVAAPAPDSPALPPALAEFSKGRDGDGGANDRANEAFGRLSESEPTNPLYLAYYGATWSLKGRDAWAPWNKMRHTEKGLALIDKALSLLGPEHEQPSAHGVPASVEVRLVAASTFLAVPGLFHKREAGKAAVAAALASPGFAIAPGAVRAQLYRLAATVARADGDAAQEAGALAHAVEEAPDGKVAAEAKARLAELRK